MNKRIFALLAALCIVLGCLAGCNSTNQPATTTVPAATEPTTQWVDYASELKLDMASNTVKQEVTVKNYVDGDTTHFYVPASILPGGVLKARYMGVNTPESTGKIEEWGKKASEFTKTRLMSASSIIIESDNGTWNPDSTGGRYLVWVWYKPDGAVDYRNLNLELLQEGLSAPSKIAEIRYSESCMNALEQAKREKLHVYSDKKDPDFYYDEAIPITLKELRTNIEEYENKKVIFEGVVNSTGGQTVYVEEYDAETDMYYGMNVYYGYGLSGKGLKMLSPGNRVKFVGSVQYYATGDSWQVSDINYSHMDPDDPDSIRLISEGHEPGYRLTEAETFYGNVDIQTYNEETDETETKTFEYGELALATSISMENLTVQRISTTTKEDSASKGAMTLYCTSGGVKVSVRTEVLYDEDGNLITAKAYEGKTINVKGIVDCFNGTYQVKVLTASDITIVE